MATEDQAQPSAHARDVAAGTRFQFGDNWADFLSVLDEARVAEAERSLSSRLGQARLDGLRLLDVGSGSGLFSLAARRLGALVHSFDYDPASVACALELRRRFAPDDPRWTIEEGSALDRGYLARLGEFDIVYSWGVLHHTGAMWQALDGVAARVRLGGRLFVALYNDQGPRSDAWRLVKRAYCASRAGRALVLTAFVPYYLGRGLLADAVRLRSPLARYATYRERRGMSFMHDVVDWLGGYPFEVASPGAVLAFLQERGFVLTRLDTAGGSSGNNEFVFRRERAGVKRDPGP